MQQFIQKIIEQTTNRVHEGGWQELFGHLGIKGNETQKGQTPIAIAQSDAIFTAVEECLQTVEEDRVKNHVLDGIHNLVPYMEDPDALSKYNAVHETMYVENA